MCEWGQPVAGSLGQGRAPFGLIGGRQDRQGFVVSGHGESIAAAPRSSIVPGVNRSSDTDIGLARSIVLPAVRDPAYRLSDGQVSDAGNPSRTVAGSSPSSRGTGLVG